MQFHTLKRVHKNKTSAEVGRGGKRGKTSGRGGKGQTARAGHKKYPEIRDMIKRIPKLRGRGKQSFKSFQEAYMPVNLETVEKLYSEGGTVSPETLLVVKAISLQSGKMPLVKILGRGTLSKKLRVSGCAISASAKAAIEKAGGQVV